MARFPRRVYGQGEEPDARFSLANERTFLAWIRTALALIAAGVAIEVLDLPVQTGLRLAAALVLGLLGMLAAVQAWVGWTRTETALRLGRALPGPTVGIILTAGVVLSVVLLGIGFLV